MIPICKCGCGKPVTIHRGVARDYVLGHGYVLAARFVAKTNREKQPPVLCACGCGQPVKYHGTKPRKYAGRHFLKWLLPILHARRVGTHRTFSAEHIANMKKAHVGKHFASPETRLKMSLAHRNQVGIWRGKHMPDWVKENMRQARLGKKLGPHSPQTIQKLKEGAIRRRTRDLVGVGLCTVGRKEKLFFDEVESFTGVTVIRQHPAFGCFLDGWLPTCCVDLEYDENHHDHPREIARDLRRDAVLSLNGIRTVRVKERDWQANKNAVMAVLAPMVAAETAAVGPCFS